MFAFVCVVCCLMFVACCAPVAAVCCLSFVVCSLILLYFVWFVVARCLVPAVCCALLSFVVYFIVGTCLLFGVAMDCRLLAAVRFCCLL